MSTLLKIVSFTSAALFALVINPAVTTTTHGQEIGDRVCVTANFPTKIKSKKVGHVFEGNVHTIIAKSDNKWCALEGIEGWLPLQYVMNLEDAEKVYSDRIDESDRDFAALAHRGMINLENEKLSEAYIDLNNSLKINKKNAATWSNRGIVFNAMGEYDKAIRDLNYAIKLNPKYAYAYFNLGVVYYAVGDHEKAVDNYSKAIEMNEKNPWFFISRGSAKIGSGDIDGAEEDYLTSLEINRRVSDAYVGLSNIYLARNDLDKAFEQAEKAVEIQPKNAVSLNHRGWVAYKKGNIEDAMFDLNRAIRYAPKLSIAYNNRAVCLVENKEYEKALEDYAKCIELSGGSATTFANRAVAYADSGDFEKAKDDFEKSLELSPDMPEVLNSYAWFLATCPDDEFRDGEKALKMAQGALVEGKDKDWNHVDTLAAAFAEVKKFDDAIKHQKVAIEMAPPEEKEEHTSRLKLYESKSPYRSEVGKGSDKQDS
jgi:tetratricopeptide (TPR) repeat protein